MGSSLDLSVFDYVVTDSNGIVGVKDGKRTPISREEWRKAFPKHRDTECKECAFAVDLDTLLAFFVPRELRDSASKKPVFVGKFTMAGWSGHSGFYLFKCPNCNETRVDYPHGYTCDGCLYIRCNHCRFKIIFTPGKYRDVYKREGVAEPPTFWEQLKIAWKFRRTMGFRISIEDYEKLKRPLNMEDQKKLIVPGGRVPTELES